MSRVASLCGHGLASRLVRRILAGLLAALVLLILQSNIAASQASSVDQSRQQDRLTIFHGDGCPHCASELEFLDGLADRFPDLVIVDHEVWNDEANRDLFREFAARYGADALAVPTTFFAEQMWVGFSDATMREIEDAVSAHFGVDTVAADTGSAWSVDVPFVGIVDIGDRNLVVATLMIGFADGMNPCSLWALSMLLAVVLHSRSRARVFTVGSVFLLVTSALYVLYMIGAYSALDYVSELAWIRLVVAGVAGTFGLVQLRSVFAAGAGALSIPDSAKPGMFARMRSLADPDRSLPGVVGGTVVLATGVSLLETPCTAGLPLLWTDMLADRDVSLNSAIPLFGLYLGIFLLDELALFVAAVFTMRATKLQEHHGQALHIVGGSLMVTLSLCMLVAPGLLDSFTGTIAVFAGTGVLASLLQLAQRRRQRRDQVLSNHSGSDRRRCRPVEPHRG